MRETESVRKELGWFSWFITRERMKKNAWKCILIAWGKWSGSIFRGGGEKMERMRVREMVGERVHHRSVVAAFNQLLTPCRLAAEPTNDAMMAVSFPRTAAYLREWWRMRKRQREKGRGGEQWWEMRWEKKVGADLFCGVLIPLRLKELQHVCMWGVWYVNKASWAMKYNHLLSALDTVQFSSVDRDPEAIV